MPCLHIAVVAETTHGASPLLDSLVRSPPRSDADAADFGALARVWEKLATSLCDADEFWNIFAADLKNEPHAMWWGAAPASRPSGTYAPGHRWDLRAAALGSLVHAR